MYYNEIPVYPIFYLLIGDYQYTIAPLLRAAYDILGYCDESLSENGHPAGVMTSQFREEVTSRRLCFQVWGLFYIYRYIYICIYMVHMYMYKYRGYTGL